MAVGNKLLASSMNNTVSSVQKKVRLPSYILGESMHIFNRLEMAALWDEKLAFHPRFTC